MGGGCVTSDDDKASLNKEKTTKLCVNFLVHPTVKAKWYVRTAKLYA